MTSRCQRYAYKLEGRTKAPCRRFLAGPEMADLRTVAVHAETDLRADFWRALAEESEH